MASNQDAAEQVKEVLRQIIKYRFWISISIAALLAVGAYFVGRRPVNEQFTKESSVILAAEKAVKKYAAPTTPIPAYEALIREKTEVVGKDVNSAWKSLYTRQAPLLTWPDIVQERFQKWGRAWPAETEDPARVMLAISEYIEAYPSYVDMVYQTFHPFNYESGDGIVAAAPKEALLRPAVFISDKLPDLGKVWASQERLWVQRTVLEVVAQVNKNAKNWDTAIVRQINGLEVANPIAQDQRSLSKGETLTASAAITAPGQEAADAAAEEAGGAAGGMAGMMQGRRGREMSGGGGMGGVAAGAGSQYDENVQFIAPPNDKNQFKILPIMMSVLIDQDHIQNFLVELENSPMSIQVMDFDLQRPTSRVVKPEKGTQASLGMGMGMMGGGRMGREGMMGGQMGGMGMGGGRAGMTGFGGMATGRGMMGREGMMGGQMGGMGMGGTAATPARKGTSVRDVDKKAERKKTDEALEKAKPPSLFDPYFDIVQVTIYGQARFYSAPPVEEAPPETKTESAEAEPAAATAVPTADAAKPAAPPAAAKAAVQPASPTATTPAAAPPAAPKAATPAPAAAVKKS